MKHFLILFAIMVLIVAVGVVAQTGDESSSTKDNDVTSETAKKDDDKTQATSPQPTATPATSAKLPRKYPIAPGVWYPGDPLPTKPSRYYRIRCWPGCHHGSPYGKYPDEPVPGKKTQ